MSANDQISQGAPDAPDGIRLFKDGRYAEAVLSLREYVSANPSDTTARAYLAACYSQTGNTISAIAEFQSLIEIEPYNHQHYGNLGVAYETVGDLQKAKESYEAAIRISPSYQNARQRLSIVCGRLGVPQPDYPGNEPGADPPEASAPPRKGTNWVLAAVLMGVVVVSAFSLARSLRVEQAKRDLVGRFESGAIMNTTVPRDVSRVRLVVRPCRGTVDAVPVYPGARQYGLPMGGGDGDGLYSELTYNTKAPLRDVEGFYEGVAHRSASSDVIGAGTSVVQIGISTRTGMVKIRAVAKPGGETEIDMLTFPPKTVTPSPDVPQDMPMPAPNARQRMPMPAPNVRQDLRIPVMGGGEEE